MIDEKERPAPVDVQDHELFDWLIKASGKSLQILKKDDSSWDVAINDGPFCAGKTFAEAALLAFLPYHATRKIRTLAL